MQRHSTRCGARADDDTGAAIIIAARHNNHTAEIRRSARRIYIL
jgi:hypothetical protein